MEPASIYLHIPFCRRRCAYCDFNTYAGEEARIPAYVDALRREMHLTAEAGRRARGAALPVHTIFFGGGTPSLLTPPQIGEILRTIRECFDMQAGAEITLEANPGTLSREYLADLRRMGVNRLSVGMQSARPGDLRMIGRRHSFEDVIQSIHWARAAGFENISLDLLFGIPGQDLRDWEFSLEMALGLNTRHLSLYSLTIEEGTPLSGWMWRGLFTPADEDLLADMMALAEERLEKAGFEHYEISNWAGQSGDHGYECRHNLQYWRNRPYFGFGAGAHACLEGQRLANAAGIREYIRLVGGGKSGLFPHGPAEVECALLDERTIMQETMMLGLRLTREGVAKDAFRERFGRGMEDAFGEEIHRLTCQGLLEWTGGGEALRLTERGRFLGNRVFMEFVGEG